MIDCLCRTTRSNKSHPQRITMGRFVRSTSRSSRRSTSPSEKLHSVRRSPPHAYLGGGAEHLYADRPPWNPTCKEIASSIIRTNCRRSQGHPAEALINPTLSALRSFCLGCDPRAGKPVLDWGRCRQNRSSACSWIYLAPGRLLPCGGLTTRAALYSRSHALQHSTCRLSSHLGLEFEVGPQL